MTTSAASELRALISGRNARLAVIGQGYVGLPLSIALAEAGFHVTGVDLNEERVALLASGASPIMDVRGDQVARLVSAGRYVATADYDALRACDAVFVCVPTPFDANKTPDLSYVFQAADGIARNIRRGQLIVLQSTTYPGTTEEAILPRLEQGGLRAGDDFFLAFVPERIDPGSKHTVETTPKVVGGVTADCTALASELLAALGTSVHAVSSPRVAEMTKLLENIFRAVNIALVNELALLAEVMGIDIWEVIGAASTKPFGYMPFRPGPGVGGHCIPIDPYYLSWKAREYDFSTRFIELAADINQAMPRHVARLVARGLGERGMTVAGSNLLVLGVAFKPDIDDPRNSPAERVMEFLIADGANVSYHDPYVAHFRVGGNVFLNQRTQLASVPLSPEAVRRSDAVVILTAHSGIDYQEVVQSARFVVDAVNATRGTGGNVLRLGAARPPGQTLQSRGVTE